MCSWHWLVSAYGLAAAVMLDLPQGCWPGVMAFSVQQAGKGRLRSKSRFHRDWSLPQGQLWVTAALFTILSRTTWIAELQYSKLMHREGPNPIPPLLIVSGLADLERFPAVHPSGPTDWDNEQSSKDGGVSLSDSSPSRTRENLLNLREPLNNLVKYRLLGPAPRDSKAVSLGMRQGNCNLKSTFIILSLSVVCHISLYQCGTCRGLVYGVYCYVLTACLLGREWKFKEGN